MYTKIKLRDAIRATTMFMIEEDIEEKYNQLVESEVDACMESMLGISEKSGLERFIRSGSNSIKRLITVMGISGERFKRVVSMLRVNKGYIFDSEWSDSKIQTELCKNQQLMDELCELFLDGSKLDKYKKLIPEYILEDFRIDSDVIGRICSKDILRKLIKTSYSTAYNKEYSDRYDSRIDKELKQITSAHGLRYEKMTLYNISEDKLNCITDTERQIIVNHQYNTTTSNGQTVYANEISDLRSNCRDYDNIIIINILDGAGWIARSADYKKVYNDCTYFLTLRKINDIELIIKEFYSI